MVETEEGKGLMPRSTFNYHLFCRNVGKKGQSRGQSPLLLPENCQNMRSKRLPRANSNFDEIEEMGGKGAASNHSML
jgi:hypothetical protein